jgi:sugar/nucleoside kinase (ribokinase family)
LDDIKTPYDKRENVMGGSASYASVAASFFAPVNLVGIVGSDFPQENIELFRDRGIDLEGLQQVEGKTFHWSGEYSLNWNNRETLEIDLNVFETFSPDLPEGYQETPVVLLGNIAPGLQIHVADQVKNPKVVIADTMDLWIKTTRDDLEALMDKIDILILNDSEAEEFSEEKNLVKAAKVLRAKGPKYVAIKKGEHGCLLFGPDDQFFMCGAFPLEDVVDPTGAGDSFAGGFAGHLARVLKGDDQLSFDHLKQAVIYGTVMASYNVQSFSAEVIKNLNQGDIDSRLDQFRAMSAF